MAQAEAQKMLDIFAKMLQFKATFSLLRKWYLNQGEKLPPLFYC